MTRWPKGPGVSQQICPMATGNGTGRVGVGIHVICVTCEATGCKCEIFRMFGGWVNMATGAQFLLSGSSGSMTGCGGAACRIDGILMPDNNRAGVAGGVLAPGQRVGRVGTA